MRITNINGTSQTTCKCGSWLDHWKNFSGQIILFCPVNGCANIDLVGAHVQRAYNIDNKWYILPLCKSHNNSSEILDVLDRYKLVSANKQQTCD